MNTKEAMDRLAKCGVVVNGLAWGEFIDPRDRNATGFHTTTLYCPVSESHASLLLEAAWHRKWPFFVVEPYATGWAVFDYEDGDGIAVVIGAPPSSETRLEAMVLAAEQAAKEDRTNG